MRLATTYDLINTALFLPSGGSGRVREALVEELRVRPGQRVLELGCGTGQVTAKLLAAGADVVAVDALPAMLEGARRRAPGARFIEGDLTRLELGDDFDVIVLAFVLHNFDARARIDVLRRAAASLRPGGRVGVLDWALPQSRIGAAFWRRFLDRLEPSGGTTQQLLDGALEDELPVAGLAIERRRPVAGGRAEIFIAA